jgi:hypothetical protein
LGAIDAKSGERKTLRNDAKKQFDPKPLLTLLFEGAITRPVYRHGNEP